MLLLARLDAGQRLDLTPVLLDPVILQAKLDFLRESPKADLRVSFRDPRMIVAGNEDYINQILENLLSNAVKYGETGQPVEVIVRKEDGCGIVEVVDRGIGIGSDGVGDLFKPFHRRTGENSQTSGLGLGLAVCKRLVEVQRGSIAAKPREGGGSVFSFALPLWPDIDDAAAESMK
jgi:two-component system sensor histidine kinase KdpD